MTSNDNNHEKRSASATVFESRKTFQHTYDIVAHIEHDHISDYHKATFKRYRPVNRINSFVYSVDLPGQRSENVVFVGKEMQTSELGYDYMIAIANKKTGLADYVPVKLVNFEKVYSTDPNVVMGIKPPSKVDYSADNTFTKELWAEKRRALISEFGSAKKLKIQESANRRQIKDETLKTMMDNSTLFSTSNMENDEDSKSTPISLLKKPVSAVLPKPNDKAVDPHHVYGLDLFFSSEEVSRLKKLSVEFLNRPRNELVDLGFPDSLFQLLKGFDVNNDKVVFILLLAAMIGFYKMIARPSKRSIKEEEWFSLPYPAEFMAKIRELFFISEFGSGNDHKRVMRISSVEKDKLLSHILCLLLQLEQQMCFPIMSWAKELTCLENKICKIATALGCSITNVSPSDGLHVGTIRVAKLVGPPSPKKNRKSVRRM